MILEASAVLLTWLLGPAMFTFLSYVVYRKEKYKKYPVGAADGIGDLVFLPAFNAIAVYYYDSIVLTLPIIMIGLVFTVGISIWFLVYRKNIEIYNDWSRPKRYHFNFGGWYHLAFFTVQTFILFTIIFALFDKPLIWIPFIGYLIVLVYYLAIQTPKLRKILSVIP